MCSMLFFPHTLGTSSLSPPTFSLMFDHPGHSDGDPSLSTGWRHNSFMGELPFFEDSESLSFLFNEPNLASPSPHSSMSFSRSDMQSVTSSIAPSSSVSQAKSDDPDDPPSVPG